MGSDTTVSIEDILLRTVARPIARAALCHANWQLRRFIQDLARSRAVQDRLLMQIIRAGEGSDFGRRHGFSRIRSYSDFVHAVPPAAYSYHEPYIERCKRGDVRALFGPAQRLLMFALTSGTTGSPKYIPVTTGSMAAHRVGWNIWIAAYLADHPQAYVRRLLQVSNPLAGETTPGGHWCGSISTELARRQKRIVQHFYATPPEVAGIIEMRARYYLIARFALMSDLGTIITPNPSTLLVLAQTIEKNAPSLIRDMHDGRIDESVELPATLRSRLLQRLRPNRARSRELERLLKAHGRLLPRDCWDPAAVAHWTGGTVGLYLPQVRSEYGDRPIRDIGLLASEGRMSIPLRDGTPAGALDIQANFYEFVPREELDSDETQNDSPTLPHGLTILRAEELQKDREYSILLTTRAGLYRYHIGDVAIVNIGSTGGLVPVAGAATYNATKAGLRMFSLALAEELRGSGVTVSLVLPGPVATDFFMGQIERVPPVVFCQSVSSPQAVARLVLDCACDGRVERVIPKGGALMPTLGYVCPGLRRVMAPLLVRIGRRKKARYLKSRGR